MKGFKKVIPGLKSGISRRLIIYILLVSLGITFIGTGLKLYVDFNREIKSIHTTFKQIESSYKNSIINSLWVTDDELLFIQMEGILQLPDIQFIEIRKGAEVLQAAGTPQSESIIEHTIPLVYVYDGKDVHLGDIHIVASLKGIYRRIFNRILIILSMQTINIFLVSLFIFIFFYQLVGKHIISMASFTESIRFDSTDQMFQLDRKLKTKEPDELEQLVTSFNLMRKNLARDINRREIAEKEIRESESKYKALFIEAQRFRDVLDKVPSYVFMKDVHSRYTYANQLTLDLFKCSAKELIGCDDSKFFPPDTVKHLLEIDSRVFNGETTNEEVDALDEKGKGNYYLEVKSPIVEEHNSNKVIGLVGISTNITERKLTEESLKESEAKLNALFTSLTEMVVMHELVLNAAGEAIDYRIIDCNKVFTEFTGIRKEDAIGKLASEVYQTDPPPYLEAYAKVALGGDPHEFTTFYPSFDKHLMVSVVSPQAGNFATITTDISDMMQIQEMIMAKNKEMENYLYVASHDLRAPLVNIQGFSQRLKNQADSIKALFTDKTLEPETLHQLSAITDENIPKALSFILSNIERMDTLLNGLLQLSRAGRVGMNIQKIDMNELFAKILQSLDFQIKEAQCEIHINPLPECYGDATLLDQLFSNLLNNALKYSGSDRALQITVDAKKVHNRVVYTVRDTGKGIAQKHLDKIWDVFYRVDPRSSTTGEGIGLSLVKRIAEKHKGKVWAESEENKGSVFYIELLTRSFTEF